MTEIQEKIEASELEDHTSSLLIKIKHQLTMLQQDMTLMGTVLQDTQKASSMTHTQLLQLIQAGVKQAFQGEINPKLKELEKKITFKSSPAFHEESSFKAKIKKYLSYIISFFMGTALASGGFYYFEKAYRETTLSKVDTLYYGYLLKEAWPHLTSQEKEHIKRLNKKKDKK